LTNESANILGIYEIPDRQICFDTRLTQVELDKAKTELQGKAIFYKGYVRIVNVDKYNSYSGEKNISAREKQMSMIPVGVIEYLMGIDTSIHTSMYTLNNHKSEIINNKSEKKGESMREENKVSSRSWLEEKENVAKLQADFPDVDVSGQVEVALDWLKSTGKAYKDYNAFMRNWCRRCVERGGTVKPRRIQQQLPEQKVVTAEQRANIAKIAALTKSVQFKKIA
jgi:hypothetical protein